MRLSTVFRKAARRIAENESVRACWAIQEAQGYPIFVAFSPAQTWYVNNILGGETRTAALYPARFTHAAAQDIRVLTLLLAAEVAGSEVA